jgi:hypothetical protein
LSPITAFVQVARLAFLQVLETTAVNFSHLRLFDQAIEPFLDRLNFVLVGNKEGAIAVIGQPCDEIRGLFRCERVLSTYFP